MRPQWNRAAEARLYAQGLQIDEARRAFRPNLSFSGNPGLLGTSLANTFDPAAFAVTLAANLTRPIYQGGRLKANIAQQNAILEQQIADYANMALNAFLEVENALDAEQHISEQILALDEAFTESRKAEQRLELRYSEGLATILELLDAQSRSLTAEGQLIAARKMQLSNRVRLHVALGGGSVKAGAFARNAAQNPEAPYPKSSKYSALKPDNKSKDPYNPNQYSSKWDRALTPDPQIFETQSYEAQTYEIER